jgi:hypothetical protein
MIKREISNAPTEIDILDLPEVDSMRSLANFDTGMFDAVKSMINDIELDPDMIINILTDKLCELTQS